MENKNKEEGQFMDKILNQENSNKLFEEYIELLINKNMKITKKRKEYFKELFGGEIFGGESLEELFATKNRKEYFEEIFGGESLEELFATKYNRKMSEDEKIEYIKDIFANKETFLGREFDEAFIDNMKQTCVSMAATREMARRVISEETGMDVALSIIKKIPFKDIKEIANRYK